MTSAGVDSRETRRSVIRQRQMSVGSPLSAASLVALIVLVLVHLDTQRMRFLEGTPRSVWLSFAGGVAVGYVFIHLLPELNRGSAAIRSVLGRLLSFAEHREYVVALVGLLVFYGLDRIAKVSKGTTRERTGGDRASPAAFWLHVGTFAVYNVLIGSLLIHRETPGLRSLAFFAFAMALHFLVSDFGFLEDCPKRLYQQYGRYLAGGGLILGWLLGLTTGLSEGLLAVLTAFLLGGSS